MNRPKHLRARTPADVVFEDQMAGVKIGLGTDPHPVPNARGSVESTLDVGLCANEHTIADLKGLKVFEAHRGADTHAVAELSRDRSPDRAAHQRVHFSFAVRETVILLDQRFRTIGGAEMPG